MTGRVCGGRTTPCSVGSSAGPALALGASGRGPSANSTRFSGGPWRAPPQGCRRGPVRTPGLAERSRALGGGWVGRQPGPHVRTVRHHRRRSRRLLSCSPWLVRTESCSVRASAGPPVFGGVPCLPRRAAGEPGSRRAERAAVHASPSLGCPVRAGGAGPDRERRPRSAGSPGAPSRQDTEEPAQLSASRRYGKEGRRAYFSGPRPPVRVRRRARGRRGDRPAGRRRFRGGRSPAVRRGAAAPSGVSMARPCRAP